jgi:hypothetical protein
MTTEQRLLSLERTVRRQRTMLWGLPVLAIGTVLVMGAGGQDQQVVRTQRLEITGMKDSPAMVLTSDADGGILQIQDHSGTSVLDLYVDSDGGAVVVRATDGRRVGILASDDEARGLLILSANEEPVVTAGADTDGGLITVRGPGDALGALFGIAGDGGGLVNVMNPAGDARIILGGKADGGEFSVLDADGQTVVAAYSDKDGGLVSVRNNQEETVVLNAALADGSGFVRVLDGQGNEKWRSP